MKEAEPLNEELIQKIVEEVLRQLEQAGAVPLPDRPVPAPEPEPVDIASTFKVFVCPSRMTAPAP